MLIHEHSNGDTVDVEAVEEVLDASLGGDVDSVRTAEPAGYHHGATIHFRRRVSTARLLPLFPTPSPLPPPPSPQHTQDTRP